MDVDGGNESSAARQNERDAADNDQANNIVASGDVDAQQRARAMNTVKGIKDRKIDEANRTTTPYMTKYERARVLGTRALQIRHVMYSISSFRILVLTWEQHERSGTGRCGR